MSSLEHLQHIAEDYFAAQPGPDNLATNIALHSGLRQALKGAYLWEGEVIKLTEITVYRLASMYEAEYLKHRAGIRYPSLFNIDVNSLLVGTRSTKQSLYSKTQAMLRARNVNTTPHNPKLQWQQPLQYLALALVETSNSWEAIKDRIDIMAVNNTNWLQFVSRAWHGQRYTND